jgi:demethylmenaquinone methyltransferase/2-methoxy-6-polyprenyl-1,4-benzoquinol methylase
MTDGPDRAASRRRYDRIATEYDRDAGQESGRFSRIVEGARKRAVAALQLEPGQTVLDVGCGTGASLSRLVAGVGATGRVVGVDQSPGMLGVGEADRSGRMDECRADRSAGGGGQASAH